MHTEPFSSHLLELRTRLLWMFFVILFTAVGFFLIKEDVLTVLIKPLAQAQGGEATLISVGVSELFFVYIKISLLASIFVCLPYLIWQSWRFIAPGLYQHEKMYVYPFMLLTPILFYLGGFFTYFEVMPLVVSFFFGFNSEFVHQLPAIDAYLKFFIRMTFAFGLAFQLPVFMLFLLKFNVLSLNKVKKIRRYVYVGVFVLAAILTPPDPVSQLMLAIPLIILFELSYFLAVIFKIGIKELPKN